MVVATPSAIFYLCFGLIQLALNALHIIRFQLTESAAISIVSNGLPRHEFFARSAQIS
jgi:hypothetical protein